MSVAALPLRHTYACGPIAITLDADAAWVERLQPELRMFDVPYAGPVVHLQFAIIPAESPPPAVRGTFLQCQRFKADRVGNDFVLGSAGGASCRFDTVGKRLIISTPPISEPLVEEVEQFLIFALVWGWRATGYIPLHVATLIRNTQCALICAESCGGKSTFTAACIRRGFRTLGDDKVLLNGGTPATVHALSTSMNLDPAVVRWFPEAAHLAALPRYSRWTVKRKVRIESLWPGATLSQGTPTLLLKLSRVPEHQPLALRPLSSAEVMEAIARQTVIPTDRPTAAAILPALMKVAGQMRGWSVQLPANAYDKPDILGPVEALFS